MTMGLKQRYTGVEDTTFDIAQDFLDSIVILGADVAIQLRKVLENNEDIFKKEGSMTYGFKIEELFYEVEIYCEDDFAPLLEDIRKINVDDYLDHINNNTKLND